MSRRNGKSNGTIRLTRLKSARLQDDHGAQRLSVLKTYKVYIGGKFPRTESGRYYILNDPKGKPIANLDPRDLAKRTKDFSGADLKAVFETAVERSLAQAMKRGQVVPVTQRELVDAAKSLKPSTKAWFESAKNYALYSNQGGFYNDVLEFLGLKK